jgi:hypothetical protein
MISSFLKTMMKNIKHHSVGTVPKSNDEKHKIPLCRNSSKI